MLNGLLVLQDGEKFKTQKHAADTPGRKSKTLQSQRDWKLFN